MTAAAFKVEHKFGDIPVAPKTSHDAADYDRELADGLFQPDGREPAVDLLGEAIERVRPLVADKTKTTKQRIHLLWAAAKKSRDLGAYDVVSDAFMALAVETNLIDERGRWTGEDVRKSERRFGAEDVAHVVNWALRGMNPFEKGPLK
jgi:hypothetical protein